MTDPITTKPTAAPAPPPSPTPAPRPQPTATPAPAAGPTPTRAPVAGDNNGASVPWDPNGPHSAIGTAPLPGTPTVEQADKPLPVAAIKEQEKAVEEAQAKVTEHEKALAQAMANYGPGLTPEQQQKYAVDFRARYDGDYKALSGKQEDLAKTLQENEARLVKAYANGEEKDLIEKSYKSLASSNPEAVLNFASGVLSDPKAAENGQAAKVYNELIEPNLTSFGAAFTAKHPDDPKAGKSAINDLERRLGPALENFKHNLEGLAPAQKAKKDYAEIREKIEKASAALEEQKTIFNKVGTEEELAEELDEFSKKWESKGGFGRSLAQLGLFLGVKDTVSDVAQGKLLKAIKDGANTAASATELLKTVSAFTEKLGPNSAYVLKSMGPIAQAITSGVNAYKDLEEFNKDGDPVLLAAAAGNALAAVGAVVAIASGPIGWGLVAVGTIASVAFENIHDKKKNDQAAREALELLGSYTDKDGKQRGLGLSAELKRVLSDNDGFTLNTLGDRYKLSGADIQKLVLMGFGDTLDPKKAGGGTLVMLDTLLAGSQGSRLPEGVMDIFAAVADKYASPADRQRAIAGMQMAVSNIRANDRELMGNAVAPGMPNNTHDMAWWNARLNGVADPSKNPYPNNQSAVLTDPIGQEGARLLASVFAGRPVGAGAGAVK